MELTLRELTKIYRKTVALDGVNLTFTPGIFGLLGPNGSGKSTLMNLITGNILPTSGEVLWEGESIWKLGKSYRGRIGYVPQHQALYPDFSVRMFLDYMAALKGIGPAEAKDSRRRILEQVNLSEVEDYKIRMLSGGMKQRLLIGQALLGDPDLLIMDEPTVGLDPSQRQQIRDLIAAAAEGKIVLIATHIVSDLERLSNTVILLKKGRIIQSGAPEQVIVAAGQEAKRHSAGHCAVVESLEDVYLYYFGER